MKLICKLALELHNSCSGFMNAAIFKILITGPIKTYDKLLLTFLKHLLAYQLHVENKL